MANKKIRELESGSLSNNNDFFVVATNGGDTVKIPYSALVTFLFGTSLVQGNNITIADATQQDGIKRYSITATATGSMWYFGNAQPASANYDDYWLRTDAEHYGDVYQYDGTNWNEVGTFAGRDGADGTTPHIDATTKHWMIGETDTNIVAEGQDGAQGQQGIQGNDGYSVSITAAPITGGTRLTISSTDPEVVDRTVDVMNGTEIIQTSSDNRQVTLLADNWVGESAPYTQTVTYSGMTALVVPEIGVVISDTVETGLEQQKQWGNITRAVSGTNSITFYCYKTKPTIDLTANVKAV